MVLEMGISVSSMNNDLAFIFETALVLTRNER